MCSLSVGAPTPSFSAISAPHTPSLTDPGYVQLVVAGAGTTGASVCRMTGRASERLVGGYDFAPAASCFRRKAAAGVEEAGFWPVISRPSLTTYGAISSPFEYIA